MLGVHEFEALDLRLYSTKQNSIEPSIGVPGVNLWVTMGDLHGNALKLLKFIHLEDIVHVSRDSYLLFVQLYEDAQSDELSLRISAANAFYQDVLPSIMVTRGANFRGLGDMLSDRGASDFFTLHLIGKLVDGGANVEIILSNHDSLFIQWMEAKLQGERVEIWEQLSEGQAESLRRLDELVELGVVQMDQLKSLYDKYKQTLKLLSYDYNEEGQFILHSHAHLDERHVLLMANGLLDTYGDYMSPEVIISLVTLCDRLNNDPHAMISEADSKALVDIINLVVRNCADKNELTDLINVNKEYMNKRQSNGNGIDPTANPVHYALWNRDDIDEEEQDRPKNPSIINSHGHHTYEQEYALCLDNRFGRPDHPDSAYVGNLVFMRTTPVNVFEIRYAQLTELMQFLVSRRNMMLDHDRQTGEMNIALSTRMRNSTVNMVCMHLINCFSEMKFDDNPTHHAETMNKSWAAIDEIITRKSNPGLVQKMKRDWGDKLMRHAPGPKATVNQVVFRWASHKEKHEATAAATMRKDGRAGTFFAH
ncbi:MAG: hypothetical protein ACHQAX_01825 [Gammaproteobacteria bacterium]